MTLVVDQASQQKEPTLASVTREDLVPVVPVKGIVGALRLTAPVKAVRTIDMVSSFPCQNFVLNRYLQQTLILKISVT